MMKIVCMYCGEVYGEKEGRDNETTTGVCPECMPGALQGARDYLYKPGVR